MDQAQSEQRDAGTPANPAPSSGGSSSGRGAVKSSLRGLDYDAQVQHLTPQAGAGIVQKKERAGAVQRKEHGEDAGMAAQGKPDLDTALDANAKKSKLTFEGKPLGKVFGIEIGGDGEGSSVKVSGSKSLPFNIPLVPPIFLGGNVGAKIYGSVTAKFDGSWEIAGGMELSGQGGIHAKFGLLEAYADAVVKIKAEPIKGVRQPDGEWVCEASSKIGLCVALVTGIKFGNNAKLQASPFGDFEVLVFDPVNWTLAPGKDAVRLGQLIEAIADRVKMAPENTLEAWAEKDAEQSLKDQKAQKEFDANIRPNEEHDNTANDRERADFNYERSPYHLEAKEEARLSEREQERRAAMRLWKPQVQAARSAAENAAWWRNEAHLKGTTVTPEAERLGGEGFTKMALLKAEVDHFELSCTDTGYEPAMIATHAQKRIARWNEIKALFDQGRAANH